MVTKHIKKSWDLLGQWAKRLTIAGSFIAGLVFLSPYVNSLIVWGKDIVALRSTVNELREDVDILGVTQGNAIDYINVLNGLLRSNMYVVDDSHYFVYQGDVKKDVRLRKSLAEDVFVFVGDGKAGVYAAFWSNDEKKYSYIDFDGQYHLIYSH